MAGMEVVARLEPLELYLKKEATKARQRNAWVPSRWDGISHLKDGTKRGHQRHWDDILGLVNPENLPVEKRIDTLNWVNLTTVEDPTVVMYTDASSKDGKSACAWMACRNDYVIAEGFTPLGDVTVFQAEVAAIQGALQWLISNPHKLKEDSCQILSDSQCAVRAISSTRVMSAWINETIQLLAQAREVLQVELSWVKGHNNLTGNEYVDALAKAARDAPAGGERRIPVALSQLKSKINNHFEEKWQKQWDSTTECKITKAFFPSVSTARWKRVRTWTKASFGLLIQAATGHSLFAAHLAHWRDIDPLCKLCCEEDETSEHIWSECPALEQWRYCFSLLEERPERPREANTYTGLLFQ